jgi:hypothetical protein
VSAIVACLFFIPAVVLASLSLYKYGTARFWQPACAKALTAVNFEMNRYYGLKTEPRP